jgi:hypothetical protein
MAPLDYEVPNSTGYGSINHNQGYVYYIRPRSHEPIKTINPSYPQARKGKRDNFKKHNQ